MKKLIVILTLLVMLSSCSTAEKRKDFIIKFQQDLIEHNVESISGYTIFPLKNGEYMINDVVDRDVFIEKFDILFDERAKNEIVSAKIEDFKSVERPYEVGINYTDLFEFIVNYSNEGTESQVMYIFGVENGKIKFVGIDMAG
ncbi:MAG: membrane lipoprotein lipid attachment site-containing protein [Bacteroidales bacterium]|nr:membrane lipoprotein lipid attachment site-containing protein [Bacteroidales bacterium]